MKKIFILGLSIFLGCQKPNSTQLLPFLYELIQPLPEWEILFSYPGRDTNPQLKNKVREKIIKIIQDTRNELILYIYGLSDELIIHELEKARERGVHIQIIADRERNYSLLEEKKIPYKIWSGSGLHHPKVLISDRKRIFTGTGNFTTQGLLLDFDSYFAIELPSEAYTKGLLEILEERNTLATYIAGVLFIDSPRNGLHIQKWILDSIRGANHSIEYLIYSHYDPVISFELMRAAKRGVRVEGIYNRPIDPEGKKLATILPKYGSWIYEEENEDRIDNGSFGLGGLLHHKTMIIDKKILLTGSYNYSRNARDSNRELFLITMDPKIVHEHLKEFFRVKLKSKLYIENEPIEESFYFLEWGRGIFHSLGLLRQPIHHLSQPQTFSYGPISSGILSFPNSSRRNLPFNYYELYTWDGQLVRETIPLNGITNTFLNGLGFIHPVQRTQILSWNTRVQGGLEFQIQEPPRDLKYKWVEMVFWPLGGTFFSIPLHPIGNGYYRANIHSELFNQSTGMIFLREEEGNWRGLGCFTMGARTQPPIYLYLLKEAILNQEKNQTITNHGRYHLHSIQNVECSRLNRAGVGGLEAIK